jgi:adenine-specific DNA methylase
MALTVKCPLCGEIIGAEDENALVAAADKHGDEKHGGMKAPRAMVLAAARKSDA